MEDADATELSLERAREVLASLHDKYSDDDYMKARLLQHVCSQLPTIMERADTCHRQREDRKKVLEEGAEGFIEGFLKGLRKELQKGSLKRILERDVQIDSLRIPYRYSLRDS